MLSLSLSSMGFAGQSAGAMLRSNAPTMVKSASLPFLEAPPQLDGSMAGDVGFDPLNLSGMFSLDYMREAELKHGRICQLACAGYVAVDNGFVALGAPKVSSLEAHDVTVKSGHMLLLLFIIALIEAPSYTATHEMMSGQSDRKPGDFGIPWKFCSPTDTATQEKFKLAEITHCRAAMMGFSGMVTASAATGAPFPYVGDLFN